MSLAPIGVFDSGVGGLSILRSIHTLMPNERLIYVADSAHAPYGLKSEAFIQKRSMAVMDYLLRQQVKAVVVACNTATAAAIAMLRERYAMPIIGVEPAVKPAAEQSRTGVVGVLATSGTIASDKFFQLQNRFSDQVEILTRACTGLVELIEQPQFDEEAVLRLLETFINPMLKKRADTLVLGCTHYSLIKQQIAKVAGADVKIVDAGAAVAKELQRRLQLQAIDNNHSQSAAVTFFTSGDPVFHQPTLRRYWDNEARFTVLA